MDHDQVFQDHTHQFLILDPVEERGVISDGVRCQQSTCSCAWEAVTGIVNEARHAVCDALSPSDAFFLPETHTEAENHLGGTGVVGWMQGLHLGPGERRLEVNEKRGLGCGCYQDVVDSEAC